MARWSRVWLGPEGLWLMISLAVYVAAAMNQPSTPAGNDFLETLWVAIPLVGIPLTFATALLPRGSGWWWLTRVVVASCIGVIVASFIAAGGVDYHDSRNSGLLGAPVYSLSIGLLLLFPLTILATLLIWKKRRASR
ncbi:MAG TPA: hypothetical protein PLY42_16170 [Nitrospira sp.]|nr:hypothetical protein [Nitrospira sp.]